MPVFFYGHLIYNIIKGVYMALNQNILNIFKQASQPNHSVLDDYKNDLMNTTKIFVNGKIQAVGKELQANRMKVMKRQRLYGISGNAIEAELNDLDMKANAQIAQLRGSVVDQWYQANKASVMAANTRDKISMTGKLKGLTKSLKSGLYNTPMELKNAATMLGLDVGHLDDNDWGNWFDNKDSTDGWLSSLQQGNQIKK